MLSIIREKLRPALIRRFRASKASAARNIQPNGHAMSSREEELFKAGFNHGFDRGWMAGAMDVTTVSPSDFPPPENPEESSEVH